MNTSFSFDIGESISTDSIIDRIACLRTQQVALIERGNDTDELEESIELLYEEIYARLGVDLN